jgi:hypothetical protein
MQDVIEHVRDPIRVIEKLHRVLRPDGRLQLRTPHFSSALAYGDPSHLQYFSALAIRLLRDVEPPVAPSRQAKREDRLAAAMVELRKVDDGSLSVADRAELRKAEAGLQEDCLAAVSPGAFAARSRELAYERQRRASLARRPGIPPGSCRLASRDPRLAPCRVVGGRRRRLSAFRRWPPLSFARRGNPPPRPAWRATSRLHILPRAVLSAPASLGPASFRSPCPRGWDTRSDVPPCAGMVFSFRSAALRQQQRSLRHPRSHAGRRRSTMG